MKVVIIVLAIIAVADIFMVLCCCKVAGVTEWRGRMKRTVEQLIEEAYHDICTGFSKYGDIIEPETVSTQIKLHKAVEAIHAGKGLNDYI